MAPFYLGFVLFSIACGVLLGHTGQLTAALIRGAGRGWNWSSHWPTSVLVVWTI